jgi:hypothetical protein
MAIHDPLIASDYADREVKAAFSVLIELGQLLKPFADGFVIVGGSVPWLLLDHGRPPHLGTLDIDIGLDPDALDEGKYATLVETLEKAGYRRDAEGLKDFQLLRTVTIDDGDPIDVVVDLLAPKGRKIRGSKPQLVHGLRVQQVDGCGVAIKNSVSRQIQGTMPDGRNNTVELPITTIAALLVMKGFALSGRDKMKDAYDIYYSVRNYPGGPAQLGKDCKALLKDEVAREGLRLLASKFQHRDDFGPQTVRRFLEDAPPEFTDLDPEQVQTDAFGQVDAFLKALAID